MKAVSNVWWLNSPNDIGDNSSGFTGFPGGARGATGKFDWYNYNVGKNGTINNYGAWWISNQSDPTHAIYYLLVSYDLNLDVYNESKRSGYSVRCIKD